MSLNNTTTRTSTINDTLNISHKRNHLGYTQTHTHTHTHTTTQQQHHSPRAVTVLALRQRLFFASLFCAVISKCYYCFDWFPEYGPLQCYQTWIQATKLPADSALLLRDWVSCQTSLRIVFYRILKEAMRKIFEGRMNISIIHLDLQTSLLIHTLFQAGTYSQRKWVIYRPIAYRSITL
jgi:hypothetical protein